MGKANTKQKSQKPKEEESELQILFKQFTKRPGVDSYIHLEDLSSYFPPGTADYALIILNQFRSSSCGLSIGDLQRLHATVSCPSITQKISDLMEGHSLPATSYRQHLISWGFNEFIWQHQVDPPKQKDDLSFLNDNVTSEDDLGNINQYLFQCLEYHVFRSNKDNLPLKRMDKKLFSARLQLDDTLLMTPLYLFLLLLNTPTSNFYTWPEASLLYSSRIHGAAFSSFFSHVVSYPAPTLLLLQNKPTTDYSKESIFGYYTTQSWEDNRGETSGDRDCFLFRLSPTFKIYRSKSHYPMQYLSYHVRKSLRGIGLGGKVEAFRFFLTSDLTKGYCCYSDSQFHPGLVIDHQKEVESDFRIDFVVTGMEVWGLGGSKAMQEFEYYQRRDHER